MNKKEFALNAIGPYVLNPEICGFDMESHHCQYLTADGRKCVAGKYMLHPEGMTGTIEHILSISTQSKVFIPEVVDILTKEEWSDLQFIHDDLASGVGFDIPDDFLFTKEELNEWLAKNK